MAVISVVVPTLGADPALLRRCLEALRSEGGRELEVVLVAQGGRAIELPAVLVDRHFELPRNLGFARATNLGIAASSGEVIATVNDDVVVEPGWLAQLQSVLATAPAVAVQGVNLVLDRPEEVDGWGIGWNPALEAVQLGRGGAAPPLEAAPFEIFGVSATAALYRREALERAALEGGEVFDSRLGSYYEDVELALRLRAAGGLALAVPAARARHAGSATGKRMGLRRGIWLFGNRHLVLARHLGSGFWRRWPGFFLRDLRHAGNALAQGDLTTALAVPLGWLRVLAKLRHFARRGGPLAAEGFPPGC